MPGTTCFRSPASGKGVKQKREEGRRKEGERGEWGLPSFWRWGGWGFPPRPRSSHSGSLPRGGALLSPEGARGPPAGIPCALSGPGAANGGCSGGWRGRGGGRALSHSAGAHGCKSPAAGKAPPAGSRSATNANAEASCWLSAVCRAPFGVEHPSRASGDGAGYSGSIPSNPSPAASLSLSSAPPSSTSSPTHFPVPGASHTRAPHWRGALTPSRGRHQSGRP